MNREFYSNIDFTDMKRRINKEIMRRSTFKWWDPLSTPKVGNDRSSPLNLPDIGERIFVDNNTYTINNPSTGSIEETKNILYPSNDSNPAGTDSLYMSSDPNTTASKFNIDEIKNFLVGLSKITDIKLFYGRDEIKDLAFRDPSGIKEVLENSENDINNVNVGYDAPFAFQIIGYDLYFLTDKEYNDGLKIGNDGNIYYEANDNAVDEALKNLVFEINNKGILTVDMPELSIIKNDPNGGIMDHLSESYPNEYMISYSYEDGEYIMPSGERDGEEVVYGEGLNPSNFYDDYGAQPGDGNYHPYNNFVTPDTTRMWIDKQNDGTFKYEPKHHGGIRSSSYGQNPRNPNIGNEYIGKPAYIGVPGTCNVACTGLCYKTCDNQCSESCETTCFSRCGNACTNACTNSCTGCSSLCLDTCKTKCENSEGYSCLKSGAKSVKMYSTGNVDGKPIENKIKAEFHKCLGCSYSCQYYPNKKTTCWDAGCMGECFVTCDIACSTSCTGGCVDNKSENRGNYKTGKGRGCSSGCTINCVGVCKGVCVGSCINSCWHACKQICVDNCEWTCKTNCGSGCENGCTQGCVNECTDRCTGSCSNLSTSRTCVGCGFNGCESTCQFDCNRNCIGVGCRSICGTDNEGLCEANCRINCMDASCTALCSNVCVDQCTTCVSGCGWQCGACSSKCSTGCESDCNVLCTVNCAHSCSNNCVYSCTEECGGCSNLCYSCVGMCIAECSVKCEVSCTNCTMMCGWWCDVQCNRECMNSCSDRCINTCSGSCATYLSSETTTITDFQPVPSDTYKIKTPKNREEERESFIILNSDIPMSKKIKDDSEYKVVLKFNDYNNTLNLYNVEDVECCVFSTPIIGGVFDLSMDSGEITVNEEMLPAELIGKKVLYDKDGVVFVLFIRHNDELVISRDVRIKVPFGFEVFGPIYDSNKNIIYGIQRFYVKKEMRS